MGKSRSNQASARLRALESSGDGYWELNLLDGSAWFSDWFRVQLDWSPDAGQDAWSALRDYLIPSSWARLLRGMRQHLEERTPLDVEVSVRHPVADPDRADPASATRRWRIRGAAERNGHGQPHQYFSGVAQDVTTEHAVREALRNEVLELRASFEALPTAVALIDARGLIARGNHRWHATAAALALEDAPLDIGRDYLHAWRRLAPLPGAGVIERLRALLHGAEIEFAEIVTIAATPAPRRIGVAARRFELDGKPQLAVIHDYHR